MTPRKIKNKENHTQTHHSLTAEKQRQSTLTEKWHLQYNGCDQTVEARRQCSDILKELTEKKTKTKPKILYSVKTSSKNEDEIKTILDLKKKKQTNIKTQNLKKTKTCTIRNAEGRSSD